ncbi:hypothetical protein ABZ897_50590 [Nonomuraea sp. NPDC046802]|uniref:hypothetical protein n=1 Tax=Nonomuraea sp. NPDC046802 TaxID=3154919 RepID=UPI0033DC89F4
MTEPTSDDPELFRDIAGRLHDAVPSLGDSGIYEAIVKMVLDGVAARNAAHAQTLMDETRVGRMGPGRDSGVDAAPHLPREMTGALVAWAYSTLGEAPSSIELAFTASGERFTLTAQRVGAGKLTPAEQRNQAEAEAHAARLQAASLRERLDDAEENVRDSLHDEILAACMDEHLLPGGGRRPDACTACIRIAEFVAGYHQHEHWALRDKWHSHAETFEALMAVANTSQKIILVQLAHHAGLRWKCGCGLSNYASERSCTGCSQDRPGYPGGDRNVPAREPRQPCPSCEGKIRERIADAMETTFGADTPQQRLLRTLANAVRMGALGRRPDKAPTGEGPIESNFRQEQ